MKSSSTRRLDAIQGIFVSVYCFNEAVVDGHILVLSSRQVFPKKEHTREELFL
jgi:hypothetical protein